jgi:hypothetical protein
MGAQNIGGGRLIMSRLNKNPLSDYVRRKIDEQHLSRHDVCVRSGGLIGESYVGAIINGTCTNVSIDKLKALARGVGADEVELARVALGDAMPTGSDQWNRAEEPAFVLLDLKSKAVISSDIAAIANQLTRLSPRERSSVMRFVQKLIEGQDKQSSDRRSKKRA